MLTCKVDKHHVRLHQLFHLVTLPGRAGGVFALQGCRRVVRGGRGGCTCRDQAPLLHMDGEDGMGSA